MKATKYKRMKVFDCQDMPDDIRKIFFKQAGSPSFSGGNDCFVKWYMYVEAKPISFYNEKLCSYKDSVNFELKPYNGNEIISEYKTSGVRYVYERGDKPVDDWLFDNGGKVGEEVIINHWW